MNGKALLIFASLAVLVLILQVAEGKKKKEESEEEEEEKKASGSAEEEKDRSPFRDVEKCHGQDWEQPKAIKKARKKCDEEFKKQEGSKDAKKGTACFAQCLWKENELITGEGKKIKLDQDAVDEFVEEMLPGSLKPHRAALKKAWKACKKEIDDEEEDDKKCAKFKPYFACIKESFTKQCGTARPASGAPAPSVPGFFSLFGK